MTSCQSRAKNLHFKRRAQTKVSARCGGKLFFHSTVKLLGLESSSMATALAALYIKHWFMSIKQTHTIQHPEMDMIGIITPSLSSQPKSQVMSFLFIWLDWISSLFSLMNLGGTSETMTVQALIRTIICQWIHLSAFPAIGDSMRLSCEPLLSGSSGCRESSFPQWRSISTNQSRFPWSINRIWIRGLFSLFHSMNQRHWETKRNWNNNWIRSFSLILLHENELKERSQTDSFSGSFTEWIQNSIYIKQCWTCPSVRWSFRFSIFPYMAFSSLQHDQTIHSKVTLRARLPLLHC